MIHRTLLMLCLLLPALTAAEDQAENQTLGGDVRVPLRVYTEMLEGLRKDPKPPPAAYAIGESTVSVDILERDERAVAEITVNTVIETFENEWTLVPILPHGAALTDARVNGEPVQLVQGPEWLAWGTNKAGAATLQIRYGADAQRSENGYVLPVLIPRAAATQIAVTFPGKDLDLVVIPSANLKRTARANDTLITASVPATSSVLVSWRVPAGQSHVISRARYQGVLDGEAITWSADFDVQVFTGETINLSLMPSSVTLSDVQIDDEPATVLEKDKHFAAILSGRGRHAVRTVFQVPVLEESGPPSATLRIPRVPVSRFELTLPGDKDVSVSPQANVLTNMSNDKTLATVYVPMSERVSFSWVDAVPDDLKAKVRANADLYHLIHADEGVLHARGMIAYTISHGESTSLAFQIPSAAQVNRIAAPSGGVSDWTVEPLEQGMKRIEVFLDRAVKGSYSLDVFYEQLINTDTAARESVMIPLLRAEGVDRQRGMVALLAGPELALSPLTEEQLSKVGANQLPAFVRNNIAMTVAHTYKYSADNPRLVVNTVAPERKKGKFDAQVDTLISLGEVTLKGSATVQIDVKAGSILGLSLGLPANINVLNVAGPSIRSHKVELSEDGQIINIEFTQDMEGQFRLEVNYEKILGEEKPELDVPTLTVHDAEVEHGRIAVEALTAVEVRALKAQQLSSLDINELPPQLVLKTTNPILLAFKYVHAEPPFALTLKTTRHKEIGVQEAAIERARYQTLLTDDGLSVTTARYFVRNSRRQFLRLQLPAGSEVWSAFVNNQPEKPAHAGNPEADADSVLVKMISSAGFPVELVYATPVGGMGVFGTARGRLPQPDMVVTQTHWDVYLPANHRYSKIESNMNVVQRGGYANPQQSAPQLQAQSRAQQLAQMGQSLKLTVPTQGIHFAFQKLYASQSDEAPWFAIQYASPAGGNLGLLISVAGVLLVWLGIFALRSRRLTSRQPLAAISIVLGAGSLVATIGYLRTEPTLASVLAVAGGIIFLAVALVPRIRAWHAQRTAR